LGTAADFALALWMKLLAAAAARDLMEEPTHEV